MLRFFFWRLDLHLDLALFKKESSSFAVVEIENFSGEDVKLQLGPFLTPFMVSGLVKTK